MVSAISICCSCRTSTRVVPAPSTIGDTLCHDCYSQIRQCSCCDREYLEEDMNELKNGKLVCTDCKDSFYKNCTSCDDLELVDEMMYVGSFAVRYCEDCQSELQIHNHEMYVE